MFREIFSCKTAKISRTVWGQRVHFFQIQIPIQYGINFWLIAWRWYQVCFFDYLNIQDQSDPAYDFRDEGDNMLTTFFHLKTKEIDFNTPTKDARAQFNEPVPLSHRTC